MYHNDTRRMYPHDKFSKCINVPQVGKRSKVIDIENALKLANADGVVTYEEIRQNLKKWDFHRFSTCACFICPK